MIIGRDCGVSQAKAFGFFVLRRAEVVMGDEVSLLPNISSRSARVMEVGKLQVMNRQRTTRGANALLIGEKSSSQVL